MLRVIEEKQPALAEICRRFDVLKLELFGSAAAHDFDPSRSDFDFIVEFPPEYDFGPWLSRLTDFKRALMELFGRRVDLSLPTALHNPWFRREADKSRVTIYEPV